MDFKLQQNAISRCKREQERELRKLGQMLDDEKSPKRREEIIEWQNEIRNILLGLIEAKQSIEALEKMKALFS